MIAALLAVAPALPLDEAGKYVAAAFIVVVGVVVLYFGIMAGKLQRMERELAELNRALALREKPEAERPDRDAGLDAPRR